MERLKEYGVESTASKLKKHIVSPNLYSPASLANSMCYAFLGQDEVEKIEMLHKRWERGISRSAGGAHLLVISSCQTNF
jgi:hypothetical protein